MNVKNVVDMSRLRLRNVALSKDTDAMIKILSCGVSDLYNRFNIKIKTELVATSTERQAYELRSKDCLMLIGLYHIDGEELHQSDVLYSKGWQWKQLNYRSFLLHKPFDGNIVAIYKASPKELDSLDDDIDLPPIMLNALVLYVAYVLNSTVLSEASVGARARAGATESDALYQRYLAECASLENQGYKIDLNPEIVSMMIKGFV